MERVTSSSVESPLKKNPNQMRGTNIFSPSLYGCGLMTGHKHRQIRKNGSEARCTVNACIRAALSDQIDTNDAISVRNSLAESGAKAGVDGLCCAVKARFCRMWPLADAVLDACTRKLPRPPPFNILPLKGLKGPPGPPDVISLSDKHFCQQGFRPGILRTVEAVQPVHGQERTLAVHLWSGVQWQNGECRGVTCSVPWCSTFRVSL